MVVAIEMPDKVAEDVGGCMLRTVVSMAPIARSCCRTGCANVDERKGGK